MILIDFYFICKMAFDTIDINSKSILFKKFIIYTVYIENQLINSFIILFFEHTTS